MAEAASFSHVCELLERETNLDRLEARGTVRLALKQAGFDASSITSSQMSVVVAKILPEELRVRGVEDEAALCDRIRSSLTSVADGPDVTSPDAVFERLGSTS